MFLAYEVAHGVADRDNHHVSTYAKRIAVATVTVDLSAIRWASALRRGLVVLIVLIVGYHYWGPAAAAHAASAALLVGLLDKGRSPRETWRVMATATGLFALIIMITGLLHGASFAMLMLMALLAFASGVSVGVDIRAPQVFVFGALLAAAYLGEPFGPRDALWSAMLVVGAGGAQTLVSWLAAPVVRDLPERKKTIAALLAVADLTEQIGIAGPSAQARVQSASKAMGAAEDFVSRSDLSGAHRKNYSLLLGDADLLRLEARAFAARELMGVLVPGDPLTRETFATATNVLRLAAQAIRRFGQSSARDELGLVVTAVHDHPPTGQLSRVGQFVHDTTISMGERVAAILADPDVHRSARSNKQPLRVRVIDSLNWRSLPFKHGARMAAAATTGELVSLAVGLPHGSWVAVTAMMLLRPDVGPTAPRIVMRAVGTTIGAALVLLVAWLCGGSPTLLTAAIGVMVVLAYALISISYGFLVALITVTVLLILSLDEPDTLFLAATRWTDVLVGCVIGTFFALVFPLWKRTSLASDAATYAAAVSVWFTSIAHCAAIEPGNRQDSLMTVRDNGKRARASRLAADATLSVSLLEPKGRKGLAPGVVGNLITAVGRCSDGGIAAQTLLRHGVRPSLVATKQANAAAQALAEVAALLGGAYPSSFEIEQLPVPIQVDSTDRIGQVLSISSKTAQQALLAAQQIRVDS